MKCRKCNHEIVALSIKLHPERWYAHLDKKHSVATLLCDMDGCRCSKPDKI